MAPESPSTLAAVGDALALLAVIAGLTAAGMRYRAVISGRSVEVVERRTATGFFGGFALGSALIIAVLSGA
jgi:hypothetical protein